MRKKRYCKVIKYDDSAVPLLYKIVNLFNYKGFRLLFRGNGVVAFLVCPPPDRAK